MPIIIDKEKFKHRSNEIRKLLLPISKKCNSISSRIAPSPRGSTIFGVFGGTTPVCMNHNEWDFKTNNENYRGSYFEIWLEKEDRFILEKAYFKLSIIKEHHSKEVLSLHIDPSVSEHKYKKGPHLHIITSIDEISKAHFSLNLSDVHEVLNSYEKFINAYKNALDMINEEIILK